MDIELSSGLLIPAPYFPSPHCDARPLGTIIDAVIIHGISLPPGQFGTPYVKEFFSGTLDSSIHPYFATIDTLRVSAHLFINRAGEVVQFVPFTMRAWHAGVSSLAGRSQCNDFSIGIELEGTDEIAYTEQQYQCLTQVLRLLLRAYPAITMARIVGHTDVAPGRKTDPGPSFDWSYLQRSLKGTVA